MAAAVAPLRPYNPYVIHSWRGNTAPPPSPLVTVENWNKYASPVVASRTEAPTCCSRITRCKITRKRVTFGLTRYSSKFLHFELPFFLSFFAVHTLKVGIQGCGLGSSCITSSHPVIVKGARDTPTTLCMPVCMPPPPFQRIDD